MSRKMVCISCPRGCILTVSEDLDVKGSGCPKGIEYARQELLRPLRMLTTTVKTTAAEMPRVPVRLSEDVDKNRLMEYMKAINRVVLDHSCKPGDVLVKDILGEGTDLIAAGEFNYEE